MEIILASVIFVTALSSVLKVQCAILETDSWLLSLIPRRSDTDAFGGSVGWAECQLKALACDGPGKETQQLCMLKTL